MGYMNANLRHPSLKTHKFDEMESPFGGDVFESYAQNKTPGAYRIFWAYGPNKTEITVWQLLHILNKQFHKSDLNLYFSQPQRYH